MMTQETVVKTSESKKTKHLILSLFFDAVGYASYGIPFLAEITDVIWAPIAGFILARMYKGTIGTVGGIFEFAEELLPGTDFIPTFTLTWMYTYLIKKEK